jgi:hypothetical protein
MIGTDAGLFFKTPSSPGYWFLPLEEASPPASERGR